MQPVNDFVRRMHVYLKCSTKVAVIMCPREGGGAQNNVHASAANEVNLTEKRGGVPWRVSVGRTDNFYSPNQVSAREF